MRSSACQTDITRPILAAAILAAETTVATPQQVVRRASVMSPPPPGMVRAWGQEGAARFVSLEAGMAPLEGSAISAPWPQFIRDVFYDDQAGQVARLQILGFTFGNGGNVDMVMQYLAVRGMLREDSGAWSTSSPSRRTSSSPPIKPSTTTSTSTTRSI